MNMSDYKKAIELITKDLDWRDICVSIAAHRPDIFIRYAQQEHIWKPTAKALVEAGKKVESIKYIRAQTGLSLKEAKDIADHL